MKRKWFTIALILLTVINLSALWIFVYNRWCHEGASSCENEEVEQGHFMKRHLGLTDEQVAKIKTSRETFDVNIEALSYKMKEKRLDLVKELMAEAPDSVRIERILRQVDSLQAALQREVAKHLLLEKEIFTPEQQKKFFSIVLERFSVGMKQEQHHENP
ncbi:periplasmic heavy metal sensor [bacterium]|nr:MAG: periplasmic heavy metal sensor [bacterium]